MVSASEIYIETSPGERRAGLLDGDGRAIAIEVERPSRPRLTGAIYLARVRSIDKRLGAAFLDLGPAGSALLARAKDLTEGEAILVQISRDAHDDKGPAALRQVILWGRYIGLQPGRGNGFQCARSLGQGRNRAMALEAAEAAIADQTDLILRAPSWTVEGSVLAAEAAALRTLWQDIQTAAKSAKAPAELLPPTDFVTWMLRDAGPEARIAFDDRLDKARAEELCAEFYPDLADTLALHSGGKSLFDEAGLSEVLEETLAPEVPLQGGGRLFIEETRALTAIDVDIGTAEQGGPNATRGPSKAEAVHRLNRRAAEEIARQIILRKISGLVVIDFAGIEGRGKMKSLLDVLRSRLRGAEGHTDVLGITAAGLVEVTRQRIGPSLADLYLSDRAVRRMSPDAEAAEVLRRALRLKGAGKPVADLSQAAADAFKGTMREALKEAETRLGQGIELRPGAARIDVRLEK
ncbi:hypothetical protein HH303_18245 [Rhodospirillaceae bacterium KN72]|uniref:RNA-binding protein AU-1/Ribonuclease E/G domain-containing protein n=1 Tax=Pacificispira spongiicola TaxID=2729598 RepID=A0A7Y0E3C6_9PROT|nr:ribonuclease E/G [Pacificispira spongiicola]NMM46438.1 hypothetical protein [Pacificispira spongiicola]